MAAIGSPRLRWRCCAWPLVAPPSHHHCQRSAALVCAASSKYIPLIKRLRKPTGKRRRNKVLADEPKRIDVDPSSASFAGRLVHEINTAPGPRSLAKIVDDFGPLLSGQHVSMALGRLAGFYTTTDVARPDRRLYR